MKNSKMVWGVREYKVIKRIFWEGGWGEGVKNRINDIQRPLLGLIMDKTQKVDFFTKQLPTKRKNKVNELYKK